MQDVEDILGIVIFFFQIVILYFQSALKAEIKRIEDKLIYFEKRINNIEKKVYDQ